MWTNSEAPLLPNISFNVKDAVCQNAVFEGGGPFEFQIPTPPPPQSFRTRLSPN